MKVTYNWLKDFVEIKITPKALADKLTMAGLEVTSIDEREGDFVFEIEVTPNRPDCLSVIGIAREVAAITGKKMKPVSRYQRIKVSKKNLRLTTYDLRLKIEDRKDCPLYTAQIIEDAKIGPSVDWLKKRLELIGCRSVNNIVDITNYILFTFGEPLHAFDLDKLSGNSIIVRRAKNNERLITIDGQERALSSDILVIADSLKPVAVAGIMGGKDTEVTASTKRILLEAAVFEPIVIRRGRQRLGLQSESCYRFERGVNLEIVEQASLQAVRLIEDLTAGKYLTSKTSGKPKAKRKKVYLNISKVPRILGVDITSARIKKILDSIEFKTFKKAKDYLLVEIPNHRQDVNLEIDLIEEVARVYGYTDIPKSLPAIKPEITIYDRRSLISFIKNILVGLGLNEVVTYSLIDKDLLSDLEIKKSFIPILNPLSKEYQILRPTIIPSLIKRIAYNLNQKQSNINIFEIAKIFSNSSNQAKEEQVLGICLCSAESSGFLQLKGISEVLLQRLGIVDYSFILADIPCEITLQINNESQGRLVQLPNAGLERLEIKNKEVFALEISLDRLLKYVNLQKRFVPWPIYPSISRDISLVLKEEARWVDILEVIKEKGKPLLQEAKITDYYKGKQIPAGSKGLTVSCIYRSDQRTLTEAEIIPIHSLVCNGLVQSLQATIR